MTNGNVHAMKWIHIFNNVEMRICWNGHTYSVKWIHIFGNIRIRARWIGPYAWRNVRNQFRGWTPPIHGVFRGCFVVCSWIFHRVFAALLQFVRHIIIICVMRNEKPFATSSPPIRHPFCEYAMRHRKLGVTCLFCGCYVFRKQKGGFCTPKTPFLYAKNPLFALQKPYF